MNRVLKWNGRDLPDELRELPPGRYVVESVDAAPDLTPEQERDLATAIDEADAGLGVSLEAARARIESTLKR
jgi:hypothetical protein